MAAIQRNVPKPDIGRASKRGSKKKPIVSNQDGICRGNVRAEVLLCRPWEKCGARWRDATQRKVMTLIGGAHADPTH